MDRRAVPAVAIVLVVVLAGCVGGVPTGVDGSNGDESPEEDGTEVDGSVEIHAIDVGQADATLLIGPEETMLIDSGNWYDDGEYVIEYLDEQGVERIDYLVSTHAHADHIGGHAAIIETYETEKEGIGQVWDPGVAHTSGVYEEYLDAIEDHDVDLIEAQSGDEIPFADGATVLNPPAERESDRLHDNSLALRVSVGERSFLATGDAESRAEERMVAEYGDELDSDLYHAGHHGSATSSTPAFLDRVDPEIAVISSARESQYDHPSEEVLASFAERGIETYWTAVHGTIVFELDGESIAVTPETDATTDPAQLKEELSDETAETLQPPEAAASAIATATAVRAEAIA
ncbi:MAG: ComEC/Rec2 family competence protein [Halalkalicoccus sp.]